MAGYLLRVATTRDAAAIATVHTESWRAAYRDLLPASLLGPYLDTQHLGRWQRLLSGHGRGRMVLVMVDAQDEVVAFASAGPSRGLSGLYDSELYTLYVLPELWRRGLGQRLLATSALRLSLFGFRGLSVWALAGNDRACRFYERFGGKIIGRQSERYGATALPQVGYGWSPITQLVARCADMPHSS